MGVQIAANCTVDKVQSTVSMHHLQGLHVLEAVAAKAGHGQHHGPRISRQLRQSQMYLQAGQKVQRQHAPAKSAETAFLAHMQAT